ncbi:hypothetical protein [Volucribacter amazonae]|uniref:Uncharacterized protein n=1 Tax=Volucribacter amazonae TaxID=256731 RepID=A0A9X4PFY8_9PAST|nr:hypothetical protein [Volucribacter amazonae]MDG6894475.1 hypothetical protein [Volucribacter amazonae]
MQQHYYLRAKSAFITQQDTEQTLRLKLKDYGIDGRRLSVFSQLALLAALPLKQDISVETNIYLASPFNSPTKFNKMFVPLMEQNIPSPLDFMANLNNATTFQLSQLFQTKGNTLFLAVNQHNYLQPFQLAQLDLQMGQIRQALVGFTYESNQVEKKQGAYWWLLTSASQAKQIVNQSEITTCFMDLIVA